jgi:ABC-type uncharacterized transport system permease subunit
MRLVSPAVFVLALVLYGAATAVFFLEIARRRAHVTDAGSERTGPLLLGLGALGHGVYVTLASFVAGVCPVRSVHFLLSMSSLVAIGVYLAARRTFRIHPLGLLVAPLGLAFLLGTAMLGSPAPEPRLSPAFITLHVLANVVGLALFLLAGGAAALYLVQERRLKQKRGPMRAGRLPPLDALDKAVHRFLVAGFPLLTLGIVTGTVWAQNLESGTADEIMRVVFGYTTWLLFAAVLLLRAMAGWRGRRAAYGTIAGLGCAAAVAIIYLVRPAVVVASATIGG